MNSFTKGEVILWWVSITLASICATSDLEEALSLLCVLSFLYSLLILAGMGNMPLFLLGLLMLGYQIAVLVLEVGLFYNSEGIKQFCPLLFDTSIYVSGVLVPAFLCISNLCISKENNERKYKI